MWEQFSWGNEIIEVHLFPHVMHDHAVDLGQQRDRLLSRGYTWI